MNIELYEQLIIVTIPALVTLIGAITTCVSTIKGIKKSEREIKMSNSATNLGKLTKAVESNAELNRSLSAENNRLIKETRELNAANKSLIESYAGKEKEYSILADQTKEMMRFIESYKAQSQADHDAVVKLVNTFRAAMIDDKFMLEAELKNAREDNEAMKAELENLNKKFDEVIANRRAR